jgi:hypothetical protein
MTIYFPNGLYGPICDIIPEPTPEIIIREVIVESSVEDTTTSTTRPPSLKKASLCKSVTVLQKYTPNGPYGPICDIASSEGTGLIDTGKYYDCPEDPVSDLPATVAIDSPPTVLLDTIGDPGLLGELECIDIDENTRICYDPRVMSECTAEDYDDILDDPSIVAERCGGLLPVNTKIKTLPIEVQPMLICGSIQRYSAHGIYEHTTPIGINSMDVIMIGAGGGAGGGDRGSNGGSGSGNNSGGTGSLLRFNISLDPSITNTIVAVVGEGGRPGIHFSNEQKKLLKSFNGGSPGGTSGQNGASGGGGGGGGSSELYINGQLIASVGGGGGGGGQGCLSFLENGSNAHKNVLCYATGGHGGLDDYQLGISGKVHVGVGNDGGNGGSDDPTSGKYGGGAGGRYETGQSKNTATIATKGGGGGHGVSLDGYHLSNGSSSSTANGASGGAYGGGGGGCAPGGTGGAGGNGAVRIKYGSSTLSYTSPGSYSWTVPVGVTSLSEVVCIGGGGSGAKDPTGDDHGSGGGGGGYAWTSDVPVTPGATLTIVVGSGGATRSSQGSNDGGDSYVKSSNSNDGCDPAPWGNWQNNLYSGDNISKTDINTNESYGFLRDAIPLFSNPPLYSVSKYHPSWSNWLAERSVWVNDHDPVQGQYQDVRINLELSSVGTHTIKVLCDNKVGIYRAAWYDPGQSSYVDGSRFYNGEPDRNPDLNSNSAFPSTLPADLNGANNWTLIGTCSDFRSSVPNTITFSNSSAGRYVFRFLLYNGEDGNNWKDNPAGLALELYNPSMNKIWSTDMYCGKYGSDHRIGDGPGGGGGGGRRGRSGLTAYDLKYGSASCQNGDSTAFGGSSGKTFVINHPAVTVEHFYQAPGGFISGYQRPGTNDESYRHGSGGFGGSRPTRFSIIFNGNEYALYNSSGSTYDVTIPGMGQGVWTNDMSGVEFPFHYFWGSTDSNPTNDLDLQRLRYGTYEGADNNSINRDGIYKPKSLELALWWNPVKIGNTWSTKIRLRGIPKWGLGAGWAVNDTVTGTFPPLQSEGTQPWWDKTSPEWGLTRNLTIYDKPANISGQYFTFQIKVTQVRNDIPGRKGDDGQIRYRYGYSLPANLPGGETYYEDNLDNTGT